MSPWRKSSRSAACGNCLEAASAGPRILVRDSKDPHGPVLSFASSEWLRFLGDVKSGKLG